MALGATIYVFTVRVANADRGVFETLEIRIARHPSETAEFLLTRLLAYCLEYGEGIAFSRGLSDPDEPAIAVRDLTGALQAWIDIGTPEAARIHKASKAAPRVAIYAHRDTGAWLERISGERIHQAQRVEIYAVDRELITALVARLERRMELDISVSERMLYVSVGDTTLTSALEPLRLGA
jgi:uncharacterized protein YaeQ